MREEGQGLPATRFLPALVGVLGALDAVAGWSHPLSSWAARAQLLGATIGLVAAGLILARPNDTLRFFGLTPSNTRHHVALMIQTLAAYVILVRGALIGTAQAYDHQLATGTHPAAAGLDPTGLAWAVSLNLALFLLAAGSWAWLAESRPRASMGLDYPVGRSAAAGVLVAGGYFGVVIAAGLILLAVGIEAPPNPQADAIRDAVTIPLAAFVAIGAALGEEAYFRGALQARLGIITQALLFGLVHAQYLNILQVVIPVIMGLVLGVLRTRAGLVACIAAHFLVNFVALTAATLT